MRRLMWFTIGFATACAIGAYFYSGYLQTAAFVAFVLSVLLWVGTHWYRPIRIVSAIFLGIAVGFTWFVGYDSLYLDSARMVDETSKEATVTALDYSYAGSYGSCFDGETTISGKNYRVRVYLHTHTDVMPADVIQGTFTFSMTSVGAKEDVSHHQGKGIFLLAYQDGETVSISPGQKQAKHMPAIWRSKLIASIDSCFSKDTAGFAKALLLGDKSDIEYKTSTDFKVSGISHVVAVSGLHVSILFGFIQLLAGKKRLLTALIGIPAIFAFTAVSGFTPSVVRAGIMQILMLLAMLLDKEYDRPTSLAFAVLCMLTVNPLVITSVSFQLSVSCMVGIFMFSEKIRNWLMDEKRLGKRKGKVTAWFACTVSVTLGAMVCTTPLVAIYFGCVSLIGVLTNLLVLWVITYIFYGIMLTCAVSFLSSTFATGIGWCISWLIRYVLRIVHILAQIPFAAVYSKSIYMIVWLVFCYGLLGVFLISKKRSVAIYSSIVALGLCICLCLSWIEPMLDSCRVTVLDVGQGQCVILQSEGKTFLVDCGGSYDVDAADMALETLLSQGINQIDGIVLSHYDKDHIGGVTYLLERIGTRSLFLPVTEDVDGIGETLSRQVTDGVVLVSENLQLSYGGTELVIFAPISYKSGNESSMCVLFRTENCAILITGDRDLQTERILLERYPLPKLDLLVAGHHGARSSTCDELLAMTQPEYAVISVGADNPYGHPSDEVLARLEKYGSQILRTDINGTIVFRR